LTRSATRRQMAAICAFPPAGVDVTCRCRSRPWTPQLGRFDPFPKPSANDRCLRIPSFHRYEFERQQRSIPVVSDCDLQWPAPCRCLLGAPRRSWYGLHAGRLGNDLGLRLTQRKGRPLGRPFSFGLQPAPNLPQRLKAASASGRKCLILLVGVRGFEPPTPSSRTMCATRLRYTPTPRPN
jgi:hypothetical protein